MKRSASAIAFMLWFCAGTTLCANGNEPASKPDQMEKRAFELTPTAAPTLTPNSQLLYGSAKRLTGNAAPLYMDAFLLIGSSANETAENAIEAYDAGDFKKFESLAGALNVPAMWQELEMASRRTYCDFAAPFREMGEGTLLPHLNSLRAMMQVVIARARLQILHGQAEEAIRTLRIGYEMSGKINDPVLVSALVAAGIERQTNDTLMDLMNRPECPNLYWDLTLLPAERQTQRRAWDAEEGWVYICIPDLARFRAGQSLSAAQWRAILTDDMAPLYAVYSDYHSVGTKPHPDPIKDASADVVRQARAFYSQGHHVGLEQAAAIDAAIVLGEFYFNQWRVAQDSMDRLRGLSYPEILARTSGDKARMKKLMAEEPTNPFYLHFSDFYSLTMTFARADREVAALTAVEAVRSYAAAHAGSLPAALADITETPVPVNPMTGKSFDYRVDGEMATLTAEDAKLPLVYTIKIRK